MYMRDWLVRGQREGKRQGEKWRERERDGLTFFLQGFSEEPGILVGLGVKTLLRDSNAEALAVLDQMLYLVLALRPFS